MNAARWIAGGAVLLAAFVLTGCMLRKKPGNTDAVDGGVRHYTDENAPKTIESREITAFSCRFETDPMHEAGLDETVLEYTFTAVRNGDTVSVHTEAVTSDRTTEKTDYEAPLSFLAELDRIVKEYDLAQHNGTFYRVSGLPPLLGADLDIAYASGETLRAGNNQSCFLPNGAMKALETLFCSQYTG